MHGIFKELVGKENEFGNYLDLEFRNMTNY